MKKWFCFIFMISALPVVAYQTGSISRPQFNAQQGPQTAADANAKPSVPGQQAVQTRSFTSYGSRPGNAWRQGVNTQTVQTQTATQAAATKDENDKAAVNAAAQLTETNKISKDAKGVIKSSTPKPAESAAEKPNPQAAQKPAAQPAQGAQDPAAMMQQLQGLQNMMGAMNGAAFGGAQGAKGAAAGAPAMPAGMPDLSALMNMAGQGNAGKK